MAEPESVAELAVALRQEARLAGERRVLAFRGPASAGREAAETALAAADLGAGNVTLVADEGYLDCEVLAPEDAHRLLGTTRDAVVLDWHVSCRPNALGQVVGAVDGGGLLVVCYPSPESWGASDCAFHRSLAVPPADPTAVRTRYHERLDALLAAHRGVGLVDVATDAVRSSGLTGAGPRKPRADPGVPDGARFPSEAYTHCLTQDQAEAVHGLECLLDTGGTAILESDRGRGKSSAAGVAAGVLAARGEDVVVTAPRRSGTEPLFARGREVMEAVGSVSGAAEYHLESASGGSVTFRDVERAAADAASTPVLIVDEAAGLPVRRLTSMLHADRVAFATTVHGYEGAGRGFTVRFRDQLAATDRTVTEIRLSTPVRYAPEDPIEAWANRTLLLDARPPVEAVLEDAGPETTTYRERSVEDLLGDEQLLRSVFGLLVEAHYRTEPNDLVRLLDAPNVRTRVLSHDGWVAAVALLAREGGLDAETRTAMYQGARISGNMLPDIFASQLRDPDAAAPRGSRVLRIATHSAIRSRGLGSSLLASIRAELQAEGTDDWLGVGYGATADLVRFWRENGYGTVHLSTTRNDTSGEYSAVMLDPLTERGQTVHDRLSNWFADRVPAVLTDALQDLDPDVGRAALAAIDAEATLDLDERGWRLIAGAAYGPGLYDVDPRPFRELALAHFLDEPGGPLSPRQERLLVAKVLQGRRWAVVADQLGFASVSECKRALGDTYAALGDAFGTDHLITERERFRD